MEAPDSLSRFRLGSELLILFAVLFVVQLYIWREGEQHTQIGELGAEEAFPELLVNPRRSDENLADSSGGNLPGICGFPPKLRLTQFVLL